jgi:hypothetical protein
MSARTYFPILPRAGHAQLWSWLAYGGAAMLAARWTRPNIWGGMCGTGLVTEFILCCFWCGVMMLLGITLSLGGSASWRVAFRLALAGLAPVAVPLVIRLA